MGVLPVFGWIGLFRYFVNYEVFNALSEFAPNASRDRCEVVEAQLAVQFKVTSYANSIIQLVTPISIRASV